MTEIILDRNDYSWSYTSFQGNCNQTTVPITSKFARSFSGQRVKSSKYADYLGRIARGEICTNNYSRSGYMFEHKPSSVYWTAYDQCENMQSTLSGYRRGTGNNSPPSTLSLPSNYGNALATATARFAAEVHKSQTQFSGSVFAGDLRKTLSMIRKPAKALDTLIQSYLNSCSNMRRRYRNKVRQSVLNNDLQDNWLEYSFGWAPLIGDTKAGAEALSRLIHDKREHAQVRGFASEKTHNLSKPTLIIGAGGRLRANAHYLDQTEISVSIRGALRFKATGPTWRAMQLFGFTPNEFVPTVWELMPMSWVTDYFSNVGDILSATYTDFSGLYWDSLTRKSKSSRTYQESSFWVFNPSSKFNGGGSGGSWTLTRQSMSRERLEDKTPNLVFNFPGNPNQIINLSAVLAKSKGVSLSLSALLK